MSRVFVATDESLGRDVVVKVLAPELAEGLSVERFTREVKLAARLQHPNIVPVLSAGTVDALPYYTMPYLDGPSLRVRLRDGQLSISETIGILRDVARALTAAHAAGVVHRDIKPDNILLSGGVAVVTDFGIAKALTSARGGGGGGGPTFAVLTQAGMSLGTPAYMAPEQAAGDEDVDHRADLYAWGLVAWEALAGRHPFDDKRSALALIGAQLTESPARLGAVRADVPDGLAWITASCLAKNPDQRPRDAHEILRALDDVSVTPTATVSPAAARTRATSLAVLPFDNLSPDAADAYFADGLTDELIADLSAIRTLRVTARGSVMRLKGTSKDNPMIAEELGVRYLVTGTVRRAKDSIRVTVTLHDATDDTALWTDKLNGSLVDVFAIQEEMAGRIAGALRLVLSPDERRLIAEHPVKDLRAYESLLRARHELWTFATPSLERAERLLENALAIVGDNAELLAALGLVQLNFMQTGQGDGAAQLARAEDYASRADALDRDSAAVLWLRGSIQWKNGAIPEAIESLERARRIEPSNAEVITFLMYVKLLAGRDEGAREAAEEACRLDPLTPLLQCMPGFVDIMAGRTHAAIPYYRKFLAMDPDNPAAHFFLAWMIAGAGEVDESIVIAEETQRLFPDTVFGALCGALALVLRGRNDEARRLLTAEILAVRFGVEFLARFLGQLFARMGDVDASIDAFEHAMHLGFTNWPYLAKLDPWVAPVREHPRFQRFLEEVRERWERGAAAAA
jgi:serine/threonine protein kinase/predicted Zn-dependent protease